MTSVANLQPEPTPILACTISRDVLNFDQLIDDMETEMGEAWGHLSFDEAKDFLAQPEAASIIFVAIAVNAMDEADLSLIGEIVRQAKALRIRIILVADQISPASLHHLLRLGADDFLPYPMPERSLHEAIERAKTPPEPAVDSAQSSRRTGQESGTGSAKLKTREDCDGVVLAVHGLAGGVGASTFASNLAWELASIPAASEREAPRVCLLDLDLQYGSVATYLDLPRKEAVFELLTDTANADSDQFLQAMQTFNDKLHILTAPADMLPLDIVSPEDIARLLALARANFDFVIIDMPKTIVAWTETVLTRSHVYFALMTLDLRSAQNVLRLLRALKTESLPHEKLRFVLNRAPGFTDLSGKGRVKRMAESLDISIEVQLPDGGDKVSQANDHGQPLSEEAAKNPLRKELQKLARSLFDLNRTAASGQR